ncbi:unnamed protein product [Rhizophagus irregularis]|nr:unnamed protein product [Rhizophagus irregularis]
MACSKVLLGNLPELTDDIIQYFRDDIPTLRSCILVNKFWCQIAIPLLWKDPFSMKNPKNFHFIEIYLQKINEKDKAQLSRCGISNNVFPTKTLFNYSNFIKCINTRNIYSIIVNWIEANKMFTCSKGRIFLLLIKIFIENEAKLHTFEIEIAYKYLESRKYFNSIFKLILQNPKFISKLKNLKLHFNEDIVKYKFDYKFLKCFYYHCNLISSLHVRFSGYKSFKHNHIILSQIINSQRNLEKIIFAHVKYINEHTLPFSSDIIPFYNIIGDSNSSKPLKDEHDLFMSDENRNLQIVLLMQLLFQNFGEYLENIGFSSNVKDVLKYRALEFINNYCKRIKFFDIYTTSIQKTHIALDSVNIFGQNLNYLSIYVLIPHNEKDESTIEMFLRLAHVLPCKLEYLNLYFNTQIRKNIWDVFLKNLKHISIKKLLFRIINLFDDILPYIKEYIMKEKRVEYLAIEGYIEIQVSTYIIHKYKSELFNMTDELREFESYNIKVKEYNDLYIKAYEFIDEMY